MAPPFVYRVWWNARVGGERRPQTARGAFSQAVENVEVQEVHHTHHDHDKADLVAEQFNGASCGCDLAGGAQGLVTYPI